MEAVDQALLAGLDLDFEDYKERMAKATT